MDKLWTCKFSKKASTKEVYLRAVYYKVRGWNFIKTLVHYVLFSQKKRVLLFLFFPRLVFHAYSKRICGEFSIKESCSLNTVGLQIYWKKLNHRNFSEKFPKFRNRLFSAASSFVLKKHITWKITWKLS